MSECSQKLTVGSTKVDWHGPATSLAASIIPAQSCFSACFSQANRHFDETAAANFFQTDSYVIGFTANINDDVRARLAADILDQELAG